jgi:hypothetical protein
MTVATREATMKWRPALRRHRHHAFEDLELVLGTVSPSSLRIETILKYILAAPSLTEFFLHGVHLHKLELVRKAVVITLPHDIGIKDR